MNSDPYSSQVQSERQEELEEGELIDDVPFQVKREVEDDPDEIVIIEPETKSVKRENTPSQPVPISSDDDEKGVAVPEVTEPVVNANADENVKHSVVCNKTISMPFHNFVHKTFYLDAYEPVEFKKEDDLAQINKLDANDYTKSALEVFITGRNLLISTDDVNSKTTIYKYARLTYNNDQKPVVFVVRNIDVARRRIIELSKDMLVFHMLPAAGTVFQNACCYMATIESFRMQIFRQPNAFSEGLVIFEDVDEITRSDRGYLWEETFAHLSNSGQYIFTMPFFTNVDTLADWLACIMHQAINCISTPTTNYKIRHYVSVEGLNYLNQVYYNGDFNPEIFPQIKSHLMIVEKNRSSYQKQKNRHLLAYESSFVRSMRTLSGTGRKPILIYTAQREKVETLANRIKTLNFSDSNEVQSINLHIDAEWKRVLPADRDLRSFNELRYFLQRGIAVYHAGITPFILELIDLLFRQGLIKAVIADNTILERTNHRFQILIVAEPRVKVNPGKTRWINSVEYRQLLNRLDPKSPDQGPVSVFVVSQEISAKEGKAIFEAPPIALIPKFVPTFNGFLNVTKRVGNKANDYVSFTFYAVTTNRNANAAPAKIRYLHMDLDQIEITSDLKEYDEKTRTLASLDSELRKKMFTEKYINNFLHPGRLVRVQIDEKDFGWGVVALKRKSGADVLLRITAESAQCRNPQYFQPFNPVYEDDIELVSMKVGFESIVAVSSGALSIPSDLRSEDARECVCRHLQMLIEQYQGLIPELTPPKLLITERSILILYTQKLKLEKDLKKLERSVSSTLHRLKSRDRIQASIDDQNALYSAFGCRDLRDEWQMRGDVLKKLQYINNDGGLTPKGLFTAQLSGVADAVVIVFVELLLTDFFEELSRDEVAMVFSVFVPMEVVQPTETVRFPENVELYNDLVAKMSKGLHHLKNRGWMNIVIDDIMKQVNPTMFPFLKFFMSRNDSFSRSAYEMQNILFEGHYATYIQRIDRLLGEVVMYNKGWNILSEKYVELFTSTRKQLDRGLATTSLVGSLMSDLY